MSTSSSRTRARRAAADERATWLLAAVLLAIVLACAAFAPPAEAKRRKERDPAWAPVLAPPPAPAPVPGNGAIFQAANGYAPLTSGTRASQIGDVLTIALVERTLATKQATQTSSRDGNIALRPPTAGPLALFSASEASLGGNNAFTGKGQATQSNALTGELTVTIAEVYPNGTLLVRGEKALTLNRGDEHVRIAGLVRASDIGPDNRVLSTRVADAKITYTGNGEVARASTQGWLQRFFTRVSPF